MNNTEIRAEITRRFRLDYDEKMDGEKTIETLFKWFHELRDATRISMELNVSLNALISNTPDGFYSYIEEAATDGGLLSHGHILCDPQYTLLRHEGNEMWIEVTFEVSE